MTISLYMDHNVPRAITVGLRLRGVDVITSFYSSCGVKYYDNHICSGTAT